MAEINKRMSDLEDVLNKVKMDFLKHLMQLQEQSGLKATNEALTDLEQKLLEKLNELFHALLAKFADKKDTKANLKAIEQ